MEKVFDTLIFVFLIIIMIISVSCLSDIEKDIYPIEQSLEIKEDSGLKFEGPSITDGSQFNIKTTGSGSFDLIIKDHFNNVISKSELDIKTGDNVFRFYTNAIEDGDYTIDFIDNFGNKVQSQKITIQ